ERHFTASRHGAAPKRFHLEWHKPVAIGRPLMRVDLPTATTPNRRRTDIDAACLAALWTALAGPFRASILTPCPIASFPFRFQPIDASLMVFRFGKRQVTEIA